MAGATTEIWEAKSRHKVMTTISLTSSLRIEPMGMDSSMVRNSAPIDQNSSALARAADLVPILGELIEQGRASTESMRDARRTSSEAFAEDGAGDIDGVDDSDGAELLDVGEPDCDEAAHDEDAGDSGDAESNSDRERAGDSDDAEPESSQEGADEVVPDSPARGGLTKVPHESDRPTRPGAVNDKVAATPPALGTLNRPWVATVPLETLEQLVAKAELALGRMLTIADGSDANERQGPAVVDAVGFAMRAAMELSQALDEAGWVSGDAKGQSAPLVGAATLVSVQPADQASSAKQVTDVDAANTTRALLNELTGSISPKVLELMKEIMPKLSDSERTVLQCASVASASPDDQHNMMRAIESLTALGFREEAIEGLKFVIGEADSEELLTGAQKQLEMAQQLPPSDSASDDDRASALLYSMLQRCAWFDPDTAMLMLQRAKNETNAAQLDAQREKIQLDTEATHRNIGEKIRQLEQNIELRAKQRAEEKKGWWAKLVNRILGPLIAAIGLVLLPFTAGLSTAMIVVGVAYAVTDLALQIASEVTGNSYSVGSLVMQAALWLVENIAGNLSPELREKIQMIGAMVVEVIIGIAMCVLTAGAGAAAGAAKIAASAGTMSARVAKLASRIQPIILRSAARVQQAAEFFSNVMSVTSGVFGIQKAYVTRDLNDSLARTAELDAALTESMMKLDEQADELKRLLMKIQQEVSQLAQMMWTTTRARAQNINVGFGSLRANA